MDNENILAKKAHCVLTLKGKLDVLKLQLEQAQEDYNSMANELLQILEASGLDSFKLDGFLFFTQTRESVKTPKTPEDKQLFFDYLKEQGIYDDMISIHSMTLNSLYKSKAEEALEHGILDFRMPGIEEPTTYKQLKIRKG